MHFGLVCVRKNFFSYYNIHVSPDSSEEPAPVDQCAYSH
jgi:hypothetical protein